MSLSQPIKITHLAQMSHAELVQQVGIEMADLFESHKSHWVPDSCGGEPNCRREEPRHD